MPEYDESSVVRSLSALSTESRIAFSAACAQRLLSGYSGRNQPRLEAALDKVWSAALRSVEEVPDWERLAAELESLVPRDDDPAYDALEDDATAAVAYAVRAVANAEPQESAWAARRAYEFADHLEGSSNSSGAEAVEEELGRQARDLEQLRTSDGAVVSSVRARALSERVSCERRT